MREQQNPELRLFPLTLALSLRERVCIDAIAED
jgi:hypothetical protein